MTVSATPVPTARARTARPDTLDMTVLEVRELTGDIRHVVFGPAAPLTGSPTLPPFDAGSHIVVHWTGEDGTTGGNAYSLTNDGAGPMTYEISVRRSDDGAGGSRWVHRLAVGDPVTVSRPRSLFRRSNRATREVLIAGGIGVTPILSHARDAARWGRPVEVIYSHRPDAAAHADELRALCDRPGASLIEVGAPEETQAELDRVLANSPIGTHAYICGPGPMIEAFRARAAEYRWPTTRVHFEAFAAPELDAGEPFEVADAATGRRIPVPSGVSALSALEDAGYTITNMCRQGVCGECRLTVTGGAPIHRDMVLTDEERSAGTSWLPCVSRCEGSTLEVALP
ncbi:PDR/VanB family oxidoreductase [Corynebacterium terpenotabidum]|uniref:Ferredoxin n=1 Tax=Corynebacterium terpenotabidum Y-11 TaxID=1200352 RepID=S4XFP4_9CORY|nr:PDR/VanB family oxidoreductase [Corynebacterium terpenotabidum]AGP30445.1 ferredoxin [Corynebacterium terpenotabidum Y-11]